MSKKSKKDDEEDEDKKPEAVIRVYQDRLKLLRRGQEYSQKDDIPKSVECYNQYLGALATFHDIEPEKLHPKFFDQERELAEMLLISHVYWDLAKAYDRSPRLQVESIRSLDQFAKFTVGFKYQYVNARMLKNFIRKRLAHNPKAFKQAYERIQVESKGCFIASDLYGENHPTTNKLRTFKSLCLKFPMGFSVVEFYYMRLSPSFFKAKVKFPKTFRFLRPLILTVLKIISMPFKGA
jgi:hypothetical protein